MMPVCALPLRSPAVASPLRPDPDAKLTGMLKNWDGPAPRGGGAEDRPADGIQAGDA